VLAKLLRKLLLVVKQVEGGAPLGILARVAMLAWVKQPLPLGRGRKRPLGAILLVLDCGLLLARLSLQMKLCVCVCVRTHEGPRLVLGSVLEIRRRQAFTRLMSMPTGTSKDPGVQLHLSILEGVEVGLSPTEKGQNVLLPLPGLAPAIHLQGLCEALALPTRRAVVAVVDRGHGGTKDDFDVISTALVAVDGVASPAAVVWWL